MHDTRITTISRPQHMLDVHAFAALTLAFIGTTTLAMAEAMDKAAAEARRRREPAVRPRARLGPRSAYYANHDAPTQRIR